MSDPKVPKTSDSESPTLVPQGNTKLQSGPPSPDSSQGSAASDAPTLIEARTPRRPQAGGPANSIWQLPALLPGTRLGGRYEILQTIGEGGMGAVYKAEDRELGRTVALKVIRPELASNPEILQRFKQEILLASKVTDRNIIRIYDLGDAEGVKFITMEFVEGDDLRHLLQGHGKVPAAEAVDIMEQAVSGLRAAHRMGIIHRDLKPGNIIRASDGRVLVMDFGLARSLQGDGMTRTGTMLGTMEYMSPEQAQAKELDARSDIFTVGLILYELLTGIMPYQAESAIASLLKRTQQRAIPVTDIDKNVPGALSNIVSKCLERDPALRYQSSDDLLADLHAWQGKRGSSKVSVSSVGLWMNRLRELSWSRIAPVALLLVVMVAATAWYFGRRQSTTVVAHAPVSVLVADFRNDTSDTLFDDTLEPMFNVALEGASFINAFNRGNARKLAQKLPHPTDKLDEQPARLVAVSQGIGAVVTGTLSRRGDKYSLSATALDAANGNVIAKSEVMAGNKDELLLAIPKLAAPIRKALGDTTPESVQLQTAGGAFTAASLEVVHDYGVGMEQQFAGNMQGALQSFSKAAELDPNFARAYAGMAAVSRNLGNAQDAEKYVKLAMAHVDRMTERERYRIRGLYYVTNGDFSKCIEEYTSLVKLYPADNLAHNNLAGCYAELRNYPKAIEELQQALQIAPNSAMYRMNLSVYENYMGDFPTAEQQVRTVIQSNPSYETAYIALAYTQLGQEQLAQATETYQKVGKVSPLGTSMSTSGLADLALYEGRLSDAVRMLESGAAADLAAKNSRAAEKFAMLAYTELWRGHKGPALEAATSALANSKKVNIRFLMARVLVEAGEASRARALADGLGAELSAEAQADAKLIEGEAAFQAKDSRKAIQLFSEGNKLLDTWMGRFGLGRAYLEAGLYVEADSEFDTCIKWRGQAMDLLDGPTYGYFPPVYYYQGRVRDGLKSSGAADSYRTYLSIRGKSGEDPLVPEIRRHLGQ